MICSYNKSSNTIHFNSSQWPMRNVVLLCFSKLWKKGCITWSDNGFGPTLEESSLEPGNLNCLSNVEIFWFVALSELFFIYDIVYACQTKSMFIIVCNWQIGFPDVFIGKDSYRFIRTKFSHLAVLVRTIR